MRIDLRFTIDCDPDAAWRAVHSPAVAAQLYGSLMQLEPLTPLPERFGATPGDDAAGETTAESAAESAAETAEETAAEAEVEVQLRLAGLLPIGRQVICVRDETWGTGASLVRTMHDEGRPLSGPLALLTGWHHRMTITPVPGEPNRAIWRDRLAFGGPVALVAWPVMWITWAWRAQRIRKLAPSWRSAEANSPETIASAL